VLHFVNSNLTWGISKIGGGEFFSGKIHEFGEIKSIGLLRTCIERFDGVIVGVEDG